MGLLAVAGLALGTAAARRRAQAAAALPDQFVLEVDLENTRLAEHVGPKGLQALFQQGGALPLARVVEALRAAGEDERVVGLLALLGGPGGSMGLAQVQELRDAVSHFRQASSRGHLQQGAGLQVLANVRWVWLVGVAPPAQCTMLPPPCQPAGSTLRAGQRQWPTLMPLARLAPAAQAFSTLPLPLT